MCLVRFNTFEERQKVNRKSTEKKEIL